MLAYCEHLFKSMCSPISVLLLLALDFQYFTPAVNIRGIKCDKVVDFPKWTGHKYVSWSDKWKLWSFHFSNFEGL